MAERKEKRTVYEVLPHPEGHWQVKRREAARAASRHGTKDDAVREGQRLCRHREPSQLVIKTSNGRIEQEYTYGSDPRHIPG